MDELDLLTRHHPEPPPPTAAELSAARAALMAHVAREHAGVPITGPVVDLAASPRHNGRRLRRAAALAGAAAALVAGLLVAGGSDRAPSPLGDRPATAAEQLAAIADAVAPYPAPPYAVRVRSVQTRDGGPEPRVDTSEARVHRAGPDVWVAEAPGCMRPCRAAMADGGLEGLAFDPGADAAEVRAGIDATVRERTEGIEGSVGGWTAEDVAQLRVSLLGALLQHAAPGPEARAEMMRMLAEVPGLTATPGERSAFGAEGTLFRFANARGEETMLLLDPSDGYVLETRRTAPPFDPDVVPDDLPEGVQLEEGPSYGFTSVTTYARPTAGPLPTAVAALAAEVAAKAPAWIADPGIVTDPPDVPVCIGGTGPMTAGEPDEVVGISVPDGLTYTWCGVP